LAKPGLKARLAGRYAKLLLFLPFICAGWLAQGRYARCLLC